MSLINTVILALFFLQLKHLIIDWIWQPEYEHKNKGILFHPGGIRHAFKNAIGTTVILTYFFYQYVGPVIVFVYFLDFTIHYLIDYSKVNINKYFALGPTTHPQFWWLTGFDQFLHQITYLYLIYLIIPSI